ncbi:unnamed protein product [Adineta steineri]|uniref:Uncharacterized protein n=1 Tax=Adineta steineri TaxID=433720 RepID=A0A819MPZ1_9BILA|nr:unnamed protein product [Adineta steineri]CAF3984875.1 unnamed protein product [Adineta steineri]
MNCILVFCTLALTIVRFTLHVQCTSSLWGVAMLDSEEGITINAGSVDPSSGRFKNQLTTFRYLGGAAAYDACSTMDQKNQV